MRNAESLQNKKCVYSTSLKDLKAFKWTRLIKEWRAQATTLYKFLKTIVDNAFNSKLGSKLKPFMGTAGAILLKEGTRGCLQSSTWLAFACFLAAQERTFILFKLIYFLLSLCTHTPAQVG